MKTTSPTASLLDSIIAASGAKTVGAALMGASVCCNEKKFKRQINEPSGNSYCYICEESLSPRQTAELYGLQVNRYHANVPAYKQLPQPQKLKQPQRPDKLQLVAITNYCGAAFTEFVSPTEAVTDYYYDSAATVRKRKIERFDAASGKRTEKTFRHQHYSNGEWVSGKPKDFSSLYGELFLPSSYAANEAIILAEGEKDCDNVMQDLGWLAVSFKASSSEIEAFLKREFAKGLRNVVIIRDGDEAGKKQSEKVASSCKQEGIFSAIIDPSELGGTLAGDSDISDFLASQEASIKQKQKLLLDAIENCLKEAEKEPPIQSEIAAMVQEQEQKLQLEIAYYQSLDKESKKIIAKEEIKRLYRLSDKAFDKLLVSASPEKDNFIEAKSLEELLADYKPIEWLMEDILPKLGITIVDGLPKAGKSFLALSLLAASHSDESKLMERNVQRNISCLWVANDEPEYILRHRFKESGLPLAANIHFLVNQQLGEKLALLDRHLSQHSPQLLVLDNLANIFVSAGLDENSATDTRLLFQELRRLSEKYQLSILIIHHQRKDNSGAKVNATRGSSAITGAVDHILHLSKLESKGGEKLRLTSDSRIAPSIDLLLSFDQELLDYEIVQPAGDGSEPAQLVNKAPTISEQILELLTNYPAGLTASEISSKLGGKNCRMQLSRLKQKEKVTVRNDGENSIYFLPAKAKKITVTLRGNSENGQSLKPIQREDDNSNSNTCSLGGEKTVTADEDYAKTELLTNKKKVSLPDNEEEENELEITPPPAKLKKQPSSKNWEIIEQQARCREYLVKLKLMTRTEFDAGKRCVEVPQFVAFGYHKSCKQFPENWTPQDWKTIADQLKLEAAIYGVKHKLPDYSAKPWIMG